MFYKITIYYYRSDVNETLSTKTMTMGSTYRGFGTLRVSVLITHALEDDRELFNIAVLIGEHRIDERSVAYI